MASNSLSWWGDSNYWAIYADYNFTTNTSSNSTTISIDFILFCYRPLKMSSSSGTFYYTLNGQRYTVSASNVTAGTWYEQYGEYPLASVTHTIAHNADGTGSAILGACGVTGSTLYYNSSYQVACAVSGNQTIKFDTVPRAAELLTATDFTDTENPVITYSNPAGNGATKLEACISLDGTNALIAYRDISKTGSTYTFNLTEAERNTLRNAIPNAESTQVTFILRLTLGSKVSTSKLTRSFSVVDCAPVITNPVVREANSTATELTGDESILIRHVSMAEYSFEATASKGASIVSYTVTNGNKKVTGLAQGVIDDIESGLFVFSATDSRGLVAEATVQVPVVEYVKPTCYQKVVTEMVGETGAIAHLTIYGNYFHGSFGVVDNTVKIEVRHTQNDSTALGDWVDVTVLLSNVGNDTYEMEFDVSGLDYSQPYVFQSRITDRLYTVQSTQYTVRVLPIFDWSNNDFNFNVPVNINGQTVLRHNKEANNTVLSGSGGHIYLRPNGTHDTDGEIVINPDGTMTAPWLRDYVIETGSEEMGTNGTWYWQKWASGKAECWGRRNYGNMAVTTSWGNLYRSAVFEQDLPFGLFTATPYAITINMIDASYGGWICKHESYAPSTSSTGGFIYVRPASATTTKSHIGFYVVGSWKDIEELPEPEPEITTVRGSLSAVTYKSSSQNVNNIATMTIGGVKYSTASSYTHAARGGDTFSVGDWIIATLTDGLITHFTYGM